MKIKIVRISSLFLIFLTLLSISACSSVLDYFIEDNVVLHYWYDDQELLFQEENNSNSLITKELPEDSEMWKFNSWRHETIYQDDQTIINYYLQKTIIKDYFVGNVFQIITYDLSKIPMSTGSGFVINDSGLFVTNAHVVDGAYYISAFFDIEDQNNNNSYTELEIEYLKYFDNSKDIAIGRINNYAKIKNHYKEINFTDNHEVGETTYSIGYPNSSTNLEIHKGEVVDDITSLYSKIIQGISYIGSTSFIAPGSSGGILINQNGDVLGITSIQVSNNNSFVVGGSISYSNFKNQINANITFNKIHKLFYPKQVKFIEYFYSLYDKKDDNLEMTKFTNVTRFVFTFYSEGTNANNLDYSIEQTLTIDSDGYIEFYSLTYWDDGMKREYALYGYYNLDNDPLKDFEFVFRYEWKTNDWYRLYSDNINYSSNLNLTLMEYDTTKGSLTSSISSSNIEYAKDLFNGYYEYLYDLFN